MRVLLVAVLALVLVGNARALPPNKDKDSAAKAKAVLILSGCKSPECATVTKAKLALATSGVIAVPAPMPREKPAATPKSELPPKSDGTVTVSAPADCLNGTCFPTIPGFVRGSDGVYRQAGVAARYERR